MDKIKTGIHTYKRSSTLNKSTGNIIDKIEIIRNYPSGYVTLLVLYLIFIATIIPQIVIQPKYEWYFAGLVSTLILASLNGMWAIGRAGLYTSLRYAIYSSLTKMKIYELGEKLGENTSYVRKGIENHHDYRSYCEAKVKHSKNAFQISWILNCLCAIVFGLAAIILTFS